MQNLLDRLMAEDPTRGRRATLCREAAEEIARLRTHAENLAVGGREVLRLVNCAWPTMQKRKHERWLEEYKGEKVALLHAALAEQDKRRREAPRKDRKA